MLANQVLAAAERDLHLGHEAGDRHDQSVPCGLDRNATRSRERVLSDSELPRFWSAFDDAGLIISTALKTILLVGQRPGEVATHAT